MFEFIDKVVYINLADRTDRKETVLKNLRSVFPEEKIVRFDAIRARPGWVGCTKSHIGAVELAKKNKWSNVLIVEDDAVLNTDEKVKKGYANLTEIVKKPYDAIILGLLACEYDEKTMRCYRSLSRVAYVVNSHYYDTLLGNFREALALQEGGMDYKLCAGDQHWWKLMKTDTWYGTFPSIFVQDNTISSIGGHMYSAKNQYK